ncbi:MAG: TetR/AcrR family transcriptional regulator [Anaerolineae bacterium]|nr:TetR/AcrR family transcriptional regulator [Anaerolineae bacterium]
MTARRRSDEKAQAILDAACRCLSEKGYAATTISEIAAEAGVSRGLLHYYFKNKEELMAKALRAAGEAMFKLFEDAFARSDSVEDLAAGLTSMLRTLVGTDPTYMNLTLECWTMARESPLVAAEMENLYVRARKAFGERLAEAQVRGIISPSLPLDGLAMFLLGSSDGLFAQFYLQPGLVNDEAVWEAVEMSIRALLGDPVQLSRIMTAGSKE